MVWYVPPLSPVLEFAAGPAGDGDPDDVFPAIDDLRIPISYLANLLAAGDEGPVRLALKRQAAMLRVMRERNLGGEPDPAVAAEVGLSFAEIDEMYRLLALGKYDERYVIPQAHAETGGDLYALQGSCGFDLPERPSPAAEEPEVDLVKMLQERG
jgi:nitrate reductase / nitrite oxidoreductase, beta subunit